MCLGGGRPLDGDQAPPTLPSGPGACPLALGVWGGGGLEGEEPTWREAAGRQPGPVKESPDPGPGNEAEKSYWTASRRG